MKKKVLIFSTDDHVIPTGGAELAFAHITQRLPNYEFDLICCKLRKGVKRFEKVGNINVYRVGFGIPKIDGFVLALFGHLYAYALMRKHSYSLLWSIMASYGAFAAVRVKKKTGLPILLTLQEGDSFEHIYRRVRFVRKSFNNIFSSADGIQAISQYLYRWGIEMGYRGAHARVIPNGVDIEQFTHTFTDDEIAQKRASFGFPQEALILITSSRLERKNGITDVINALHLLPSHVCFVVCGSGSLEPAIKEQVRTLGLEDRVRFLGFVDPSALPLLMKASDIFIRPSLSEGLGNAFLEAMAAGVVTVGTPVGGIPDFLVDGQSGFFVQPENPESIVAAVQKIQELDPSKKAAILNAARQMVIDTYNWDVITEQMEDLFEELMQRKKNELY